MTTSRLERKFILNPISKLVVVFFLAATVLKSTNDKYSILIVLLFAFLYCVYKMPLKGIKIIALYMGILLIINSGDLSGLHPFFKMFVSFLIVAKIFYFPVMAGMFFLTTSEVGAILSSMDTLRIPSVVSIPIS